jgi:mannose-6-phosphate isomerase
LSNPDPTARPLKLAPTLCDRVWGSLDTEPWCRNTGRRKLGEVWFPASDGVGILVKFLFTSDKLSVQVHPADDYARLHHDSCGKTEIWHILRAEPDAQVAVGLRETVTPERLHDAALSGEIMELLNWMPARVGDTFFVPAGAVHAIGGGLVVCEIQQHSDVTYRLYDYGRPRELHLDHALKVAIPGPFEARTALPFECPWFRAEPLAVRGSLTIPSAPCNAIYVAIEGEGTIAGEPFKAGEAWENPEGAAPFEIASPNARFLIASRPR